MTDSKPGSLDALLARAFDAGIVANAKAQIQEVPPFLRQQFLRDEFAKWRASLLAEEGAKCNSCRLNNTWIDGRCTNCGKTGEPEPIHLLERGNRQRTVCEIDIDGLFRNPETTRTLADATCPDCRRGRGKGCFS